MGIVLTKELKRMDKAWKLEELPELKVGDNLAFKAKGWGKLAAAIIKAKTFHWEMLGDRLVDDEISVGDWSCVGSTDKGITTHLLSQYQYRHMRIYRPKLSPGVQETLKPYILKRFSYWGDQHYDVKGVIMVALWCLLRKLGFKVEWWEHNSSKFWCLEFNNIVWRDFDFALVPDSEPPYPTNMERSPRLELIWSTF